MLNQHRLSLVMEILMAYYARGAICREWFMLRRDAFDNSDLNLRIYYRFPRVVLKSHLPSDAHREPSNPGRSGVQPMPYRDTRYSGAGFWTAEVALPTVSGKKCNMRSDVISITCEKSEHFVTFNSTKVIK